MSSFSRTILSAFKSDFLIPAGVILFYVIFLIFVRGRLPSSAEIVADFAALYSQYGYQIIFAAAALEALVIACFFVPGMVTIALGAIFARAGNIELTFVVLSAATGATLGYILDFILGHAGFGRVVERAGYGGMLKKVKGQLGSRRRQSALFLGFAHPNVAAFISLALGATRMNFWRFLVVALLSALIWSTIWGVLIYSVGDVVLTLITRYSFLLALAAVAGLFLSRLLGKGEKD